MNFRFIDVVDLPYHWPMATSMTIADWQLWQPWLQECLGLDRWQKLSSPLGIWFPSTSRWLWSHDGLVVVAQSFALDIFCSSSMLKCSQQFHNFGSIDSPPWLSTSWYKAMVNQYKSYLYLTGYGAIHERTQNDWVGLDALLTSSFVQDWNLQIMVIGWLTELRNDLQNGRDMWSVMGHIAIKWVLLPGESKGRIKWIGS